MPLPAEKSNQSPNMGSDSQQEEKEKVGWMMIAGIVVLALFDGFLALSVALRRMLSEGIEIGAGHYIGAFSLPFILAVIVTAIFSLSKSYKNPKAQAKVVLLLALQQNGLHFGDKMWRKIFSSKHVQLLLS
jgi:hypothetical protein